MMRKLLAAVVAGADGAIAADAVMKSPPDDYTLFMATSSAMSAVQLASFARLDMVRASGRRNW